MDRTRVIRFVFFAAGVLLVAKAFQLQIIDNSIQQRANATAMDRFVVYPSRGLIYDRNGQLMVYNEPLYDLMVTYNQLDEDMDTLSFCQLLGIDIVDFEKLISKDWSSGRYSKNIPFVFMNKIEASLMTRFQENLYRFPGFFVQRRNVRGYPNDSAPHVLGFVREVNSEEVLTEGEDYQLGDYIGATGLEEIYEPVLKGEKGVRYVLKDNLGRDAGSYERGTLDLPATAGKDLISTIDMDLQAYALSLMKHKRGSVVAIEPKSGEVLALVSTPGYDPNDLTIGRQRSATFRQLLLDEDKPFFNRGTMAQYPPGSLFKPLVGLVAIDMGLVEANEKISCNGAYYYNGRMFTGCRNHPECGGIADAIKYSCNTYFVTVFRRMIDQYGYYEPGKGLDTFNLFLDQFGLGKKIGVDLSNEKRGFYPTSGYFDEWYKGQRWNSLWIQSLAIGQGEMLTTNLQLANIAAMLANRGYYIQPHLIKATIEEGQSIKWRVNRVEVGIEAISFKPIIDGMEEVVKNGTAKLAQIPEVEVCGKTGTAENPQGEDHSIFFAFAPKENPQIAIVAYIENGGSGGATAAPLASLVMEKYLKGMIPSSRKWIEQYVLNKQTEKTP
jgi:penicillin-binding protein 2